VTTRAQHAVEVGIPREGVLIDPTHDFGKNTWHSLELLRRADELVATGWPVLMSLSNKDFVGETLDAEVSDRVDGTLAATALAASAGARVFRAHQVKRTRHVLEMVASIQGTRLPARCVRGLV
jgi:dihydropteroate synthase